MAKVQNCPFKFAQKSKIFYDGLRWTSPIMLTRMRIAIKTADKASGVQIVEIRISHFYEERY